jgi:hypothetical protein
MCGIIGFLTDKPSEQNYSLLGDLLYISASRGTDATGVAVTKGKRIKVVKEDIPADKFIKKHYGELKEDISKSKVVLGHTRLATQGHQSENNNNHPIVGPKFVMVHNGTCSSMDRIKDYPYKGTVDSEILLSHVETKGLKEGLKALKGSAAVALVSPEKPDEVYLWRHNNPLWVAYNPEKKTIFFGSTKEILEEGLSDLLNFFSSYHMRELPEDCLYRITCDPLKIEFIEEIEPVGWGYSYGKRGRGKVITCYGASGYAYDEEYYDGMYGWASGSAASANTGNTPLNSDTPPDPEKEKKYSTFYKEIICCRWDPKSKIYTTEPAPPAESTTTRFYFNGPSYDFEHWRKLEGGGTVSVDKKLVKFFDKEKKSHFIMLVTDAIKEGLIDLSK